MVCTSNFPKRGMVVISTLNGVTGIRQNLETSVPDNYAFRLSGPNVYGFVAFHLQIQ